MLKYVPAIVGLAAIVNLTTGCEDEARVRVRQPRVQYVVAPPAPRQEVIVTQPRTEVVTVAAPRTEIVAVAAPRPEVVEEEVIVESGPPVEHIRMAPQVVYGGRNVYWYGNRWYYQNGGRWSYYRNEPIGLRGRRYVIR
jgi:hypothetical protein